MQDKSLRRSIFLISYTALLAVAVFHLSQIFQYLKEVLEVAMPFFIGFGMAFVLTQPCNFFLKWMQKLLPQRKYALQNGLAVTLTYLSVILLIIGVISVVIPKLVENINVFVESLKLYTANLQSWLTELAARSDNEFVADFSVDLSGVFDYLSSSLERILSEAMSVASVAMSQVMAVTGSMVSVVVNSVVAVVFSIYMLADRKNLAQQCKRVLFAYVPKNTADKVYFVTKMAGETFSKFVIGQITEAFILGGLCALGMLFIQADYALLIGIIVGVTALVPVAGGYIGGGFAFVLLFMVSPMRAVIFMVFLLILQQLEGNLIYPRVVGASLGLPGLWVVAAVIIGGGLFSLAGALLSVPTVSVLYALLRLDVQRREELAGSLAVTAVEGSVEKLDSQENRAEKKKKK